jgi:hypothetical protein
LKITSFAHFSFGQLAAGIVALTEISDRDQRGQLQALQCPTFSGSGEAARNSHERQVAIRSATNFGSSGAIILDASARA